MSRDNHHTKDSPLSRELRLPEPAIPTEDQPERCPWKIAMEQQPERLETVESEITTGGPTMAEETKQETEASACSLHTTHTRTDDASSNNPQVACVGPRPRLKRKIGFLCFFYVLGVGCMTGHWAYYIHLNGTVVGDRFVQQKNIRVGTALAVLAQFSFVTAVWLSYTQSLWLNVTRTAMSPDALNAAFGANESILSLFNTEMLRKFKSGSILALLAWCLLLPAFFTPATLFVKQGTQTYEVTQQVPSLAISTAGEGHRFAYSPPTERNMSRHRRPGDHESKRRTFAGPRTALSLVSTATAALGEILPLPAPHEKSSYNISFHGPAVACGLANDTAGRMIDEFLEEKMAKRLGTAREVDNAYYAFVPVWGEDGMLKPFAKPQERGPSNGTNEIWISFSKYVNNAVQDRDVAARQRRRQRERLVCMLHNATYDLDFSWDDGAQMVSGRTRLGEPVSFPTAEQAKIDEGPSDMTQHAYAAFMWVVTDQLVGSMSWFEDETKKDGGDLGLDPQGRPEFTDSNPSSGDTLDSGASQMHHKDGSKRQRSNMASPAPAQFGVIDTPLEHNILLGCDDLDVFFDFSHRLYSFDESRMEGLKDQRRRDKDMAGGLSLGELIEELSFNVTVSLLQNELLTYPVDAIVTKVDDVNRYGYLPLGLFLPYCLASFFTLLAVIWGCYLYLRYGAMPAKSFSDVAMATRDPAIISHLEERKGLLIAVQDGGSNNVVFKSWKSLESSGSDGAPGEP